VAYSGGWPGGGCWPQVGRTGRHLLDDLKHYCEHGTPSPRKQRKLDRAAADPHLPGPAGPR
jgi:hypothetical protein